MARGKVKFFNESKGYGFIIDHDSNEEIFVHEKGVKGGTLKENDEVSFETEETKKGTNAINVELV